MPNTVLSAHHVTAAKLPTQTTFIGGEFHEGTGQAWTNTYPPSGQSLAQLCGSGPEQVGAAVAAARAALPAWRSLAPEARAAILNTGADNLLDDLDRLSTLIVLDNGKTLREAQGDVRAAAGLLRSAAGWATRLKGDTLPQSEGLLRLTVHEPVGVVAVFMPFNAPVMFCGMKIAPAIATGNTVVVKAPIQSPYGAIAFAEHLVAAGLPDGVVNILQGGAEVGSTLAESDGIDMISFTGSSHVGALVGATAVRKFNRVLLELGGKSANIVFDDAPFDAAVTGSRDAIFRNAGQRCFSGSRLLVQNGVADRFIAAYVAAASSIRVGDPFDPQTEVGSLISSADVHRVESIIEDALSQGAQVLCGGIRPENGATSGYLMPTVIDVTSAPRARIVSEEIFGPVVVVQRFETIEEAIELANSTDYALAGGCWSQNIDAALRTASEVDAGLFWINDYGAPGGPEATLGGRRNSGFGQEKGEDGIRSYVNVKTIIIRIQKD